MAQSVFRDVSCPVKMGLYETSSTLPDGGKIGMRLPLIDGRVFHLAKAGTSNLLVGKMGQGAAPEAQHLKCAVAAAAAIGDMRVSVTLGSVAAAANLYAEGSLHIDTGTGLGTGYKVSDHLAIVLSTAGYFNLYDPIAVALDTSSYATLCKNRWDGAVVAPNGGLTQKAVGVPLVPVTASYYYWAQTWGPCPLLTQGTVVIGQPVGLGGTADGACGPIGAYTTAVWGTVMRVNASTEYSLIDLIIAG